jgi:hypothetical protein
MLKLKPMKLIPVKKLFAKKIVWKVGDILNLANFIPSNFRKPIIFGYKYLPGLCFLIQLYAVSPAQAFQLSNKAQISLITGSPGTELYALFGHSAIRVSDPMFGVDYLFNYGTFDFEAPNFMMKFVQRKLNYSLSVGDYPRFVSYYASEGRSVYEQVLDLSQAQKQVLFDFLENNARPKNREYLYDFFFDNCSSRIRDVFRKVFKQDIQFDLAEKGTKPTFKTMITPYLKDEWVYLGIYLILGLPADRQATASDKMFLPDYLLEAFDVAKIRDGGTWKPLVKSKVTGNQAITARPTPYVLSPIVVFTMLSLLIVGITYLNRKQQKVGRGLDFGLFFFLGLIGAFFMFTWLGTDHQALPMNMNMLWALPSHLIVSFWLLRKQRPDWVKRYFLMAGILQIALLLGWYSLPQRLHFALIPFILVIGLRAFWVAKNKPAK